MNCLETNYIPVTIPKKYRELEDGELVRPEDMQLSILGWYPIRTENIPYPYLKGRHALIIRYVDYRKKMISKGIKILKSPPNSYPCTEENFGVLFDALHAAIELLEENKINIKE